MLVTCSPEKNMVVVSDDVSTVVIDTSTCKSFQVHNLIVKEGAHEAYVEFITCNEEWLEDIRSFSDIWSFNGKEI